MLTTSCLPTKIILTSVETKYSSLKEINELFVDFCLTFDITAINMEALDFLVKEHFNSRTFKTEIRTGIVKFLMTKNIIQMDYVINGKRTTPTRMFGDDSEFEF